MPDVVEISARNAGWVVEAEKCSRADGFGWDVPGKPHLRRGIGFACSFKNVGFSFGAPEQCSAKIVLKGSTEIEEAIVYHSAAEVGQGVHTAIRQMAAEALSLPIEKINLVASDTLVTPNSGSVSASRMTFMSGNSIRGAAEEVLKKWAAEERPAEALFVYKPPRTTPLDPETGKSEPNFAYGYVAQAVEVEVDMETGMVHLLNVICGDDVGQAINPMLVQGQVEGAVVQAAGYALLENFISKDARPLTQTLSTYLIPHRVGYSG